MATGQGSGDKAHAVRRVTVPGHSREFPEGVPSPHRFRDGVCCCLQEVTQGMRWDHGRTKHVRAKQNPNGEPEEREGHAPLA